MSAQSLLSQLEALCGNLSKNGWRSVFAAHGLDVSQASAEESCNPNSTGNFQG